MSLFGFLKDDATNRIFQQGNWQGKYKMTNTAHLLMGKENKPIEIESVAMLEVYQEIFSKEIQNRIKYTSIEATKKDKILVGENEKMVEAIACIHSTIQVLRNESGAIIQLLNYENMNREWEVWQQQQLPSLIEDKANQQQFIKNYEKGFKELPDLIKSNLSYIALLPECYKFKTYHRTEDHTAEKVYKSRLIENLIYYYKFHEQTYTVIADNKIEINLLASLVDYANRIDSFYEKNMPHYSIKDYKVSLSATYVMSQNTSKLLSSEIKLIEQLHADFVYTNTIKTMIVEPE